MYEQYIPGLSNAIVYMGKRGQTGTSSNPIDQPLIPDERCIDCVPQRRQSRKNVSREAWTARPSSDCSP